MSLAPENRKLEGTIASLLLVSYALIMTLRVDFARFLLLETVFKYTHIFEPSQQGQ